MDDAMTIVNTGATMAVNGASATMALPVVSGSVPKYCRFAATAPCYVRVGTAGVTAVPGDVLVQPADSLVLRTHSLTHFAAVQVGGAGQLQVSPVEDM